MRSILEAFRDWLYQKLGGKIATPQKETMHTVEIQNTTLYACPPIRSSHTQPRRQIKRPPTMTERSSRQTRSGEVDYAVSKKNVTIYACPVVTHHAEPARPMVTKYACPRIKNPPRRADSGKVTKYACPTVPSKNNPRGS